MVMMSGSLFLQRINNNNKTYWDINNHIQNKCHYFLWLQQLIIMGTVQEISLYLI